MIFVCGIFKQMVNIFAKLKLQLCNNVEYISYYELLSYCYMYLLYITLT